MSGSSAGLQKVPRSLHLSFFRIRLLHSRSPRTSELRRMDSCTSEFPMLRRSSSQQHHIRRRGISLLETTPRKVNLGGLEG